MKICMVYTGSLNQVGGVGTHIRMLTRGLAKNGISTYCIFAGKEDSIEDLLLAFLITARIPYLP